MADPTTALRKREFAAGVNAGKQNTPAAKSSKEAKSFWGYGVQLGKNISLRNSRLDYVRHGYGN
jgi:hypothetical protein